MESSRRKDALKGTSLDHSQERQDVEKSVQKEQERQAKAQQKKNELLKSPMFSLMNKIKTAMDTCMIDPILGFIVPEAGDILSSVLALPFIYFSLFKVKSLRLTLACLYNTLIDMTIGLIPILGDFFDAFHRSYKKNLDLIVGYVDNDKEVKSEINRKSAGVFLVLLAFAGMLYLSYTLFRSMYHGIFG